MKPRTDGDRYERTARRMSLTGAVISGVLGSACAWTAGAAQGAPAVFPSVFVGLATALPVWISGWYLWMDYKARSMVARTPDGFSPIAHETSVKLSPKEGGIVTVVDNHGNDVEFLKTGIPLWKMQALSRQLVAGRRELTMDSLVRDRISKYLSAGQYKRLIKWLAGKGGVVQRTRNPRSGYNITLAGWQILRDFAHSPAPNSVSRSKN